MSAVQTEHILSHTSPNEHSMIFNGSPHQVLIRQVDIQSSSIGHENVPTQAVDNKVILTHAERSMRRA